VNTLFEGMLFKGFTKVGLTSSGGMSLFSTDDVKFPFRPFLFPNMIYFRTFRCSERAVQHFGLSVHEDFHSGDAITPREVLKVIQKLAERNDCVVLVGFKNVRDKPRAYMAAALAIDCIPLLKCEFYKNPSIETMLACSSRKMTYYCNRKCQGLNWPGHTKACRGCRARG
jgi:hypothetical protein